MTDRLGQDEGGERVAGDVERPERVEVVEVLGQRLELVAAAQQGLQRAQLAHVRQQSPEAVAGHVERRQQLTTTTTTTFQRRQSRIRFTV